jgi:hypothetical protein
VNSIGMIQNQGQCDVIVVVVMKLRILLQKKTLLHFMNI